MTYTVQALDEPRADVPRHRDGQERALPDRHRLPDRPGRARRWSCTRASRRCKGRHARLQALRPLRPEPQRQRRRRRPATAAPDTGAVAATAATRARRLGPGHRDQRAPTATTRSPVFSALDADAAFTPGLQRLRGRGERRPHAARRGAPADRDLHRRARPATSSRPRRSTSATTATFTLALGFGDEPGRRRSASASEHAARRRCRLTALEYARRLACATTHDLRRAAAPARRLAAATGTTLLDTYYLSANYVKAAEDKTFPGAVAAALASPWGQAISAGDPANTYFGSYREVFGARPLRGVDGRLPRAATATLARDMTRFLFERQQLPDGSMPRNSLTNGKPAPD